MKPKITGSWFHFSIEARASARLSDHLAEQPKVRVHRVTRATLGVLRACQQPVDHALIVRVERIGFGPSIHTSRVSGSVNTKSLPNAFEGVEKPAGTSPASTRSTAARAEETVNR